MALRASNGAPSVEQQPRYLAEASRRVQEQGFYAKKACGARDLPGALRHSSDMLRELRTSLLTPRNYYELYMKVCDELRHLDQFFQQLVADGTPAADIYERAQACGDVLPRLYLLITAGAVYVKTMQAPARDILHDLVEMAKGVQHPMRGLFLRHYLAQACKDALPDTGSKFEGDGGDVSHAVDFILRNFGETNRLWVRMQNQGPASQKKRREEERKQLKILVGTNLVRLSQLEGVDEARYASDVLPPLLEQVVNCRDAIAQPYLLDCIINVFPDEFHLATLDSFLTCCTQLRDKVCVRSILEAMMRRLANGARQEDSEMVGPPGAFDAFDACASRLVEEKKEALKVCDLIQLRAALLEFAVECYPGELEYVQRCLANTSSAITVDVVGDDALELETLLLAPVSSQQMTLSALLSLDDVAPLCRRLPLEQRKNVARRCLRRVLDGDDALDSPEAVVKLCAILEPLLCGDDSSMNDETLEKEQTSVASLAHLCRSESTDDVFRVLGTLRRALGKGGSRRTAYTLPALAYRGLELARVANGPEFSARKVFQFVHETATALAGVAPARALRVFLAAALEADAQCLGAISYEFVSQAFILYEDELPDSKAQVKALRSMVGTLLAAENCDAADYDALAAKATQYAAKLFRKPDQCRMVAACSHLFWPPQRVEAVEAPPPPADDDAATVEDAPPPPAPKPAKEGRKRDPKRVLECLQRSLKTADACMTSAQPPISLFVEILDHYLAHLEAGNPLITPKYIAGLVALITEHVETMEAGEAREAVERHYANTRALIKARGVIELD